MPGHIHHIEAAYIIVVSDGIITNPQDTVQDFYESNNLTE